MDQKVDIYAVNETQSVELLSGFIDERLIPGFMVTMSRFRHYLPIRVYFNGRQCVGYEVTANGQFNLQMQAVANG